MNTINEILELKKLKNPPQKLYFKGNLDLLKKRKVSIVGSRKMNIYTKNLVLQIANELKKRDICVVSGGAIGVDITSHVGAYPNTIAVFANGLDQIYPKINEKIIRQIYENSLALSEYEPNKMPNQGSFLERNRIVVALGEALIVAQADFKSGSIQSARLAYELGIPIFVLPQRIGDSDGTNFLLNQERAKLIYDIKKFVNSFGEILENRDEILEFILKNDSFNDAFLKFRDKIYDYEIEGKIQIMGTKIFVK